MSIKPKTVEGYSRDQAELVRATCLYVATILGDLMDSVVIVGGLVPSLLVRQDELEGAERHPGTLDLDIGLHATVLDEKRYQAISERLRGAGFVQGTNDKGNFTRQTWRISIGSGNVTVDFLIPPTRSSDRGGNLKNLEQDFAAIIAPGLHLAFVNKVKLTLKGNTIKGEYAERDIYVAGPGAFTVLKALSFDLRGENKDAFDLFYVARNYGSGPQDVGLALSSLMSHGPAKEAVAILRRDFTRPDAVGVKRAASFLYGRDDADTQADVVGVVLAVLKALDG